MKNQPKRLLVWWVDSGLNQLALSSSFFGDVLGFQEREREREQLEGADLVCFQQESIKKRISKPESFYSFLEPILIGLVRP